MKYLLTVVESEHVAYVKFDINADQGRATKLRAQGSIKTVDPIDYRESYLRLIGEFDSREDAQIAAARYAAARGFIVGEWKESNPMTPDGQIVSSFVATASPPNEAGS
jgi:hypothetical protein